MLRASPEVHRGAGLRACDVRRGASLRACDVQNRRHGGLRHALVALALALAVPGFAELKWDSREVVIKVRATDSAGHASYGFVNTGDQPITITDVRPGCGCTVPALAKNTYAPGERGEITIEFHPGSREGVSRIPITVTTQDAATTTLQFVADIETLLTFDTRFVYWKGSEARTPKRMHLTFSEGQAATLAEVKSNNPQFTTTFHPVGDTGREFEIEVAPPTEANNYTAITVRAVVGAEKAERDFTVVARTMDGVVATQDQSSQLKAGKK